MKITQRHGKPAFTLIELMAVITIIVILAGLVVAGLGFVTERQAKEKARVQMALLTKALEEYKLDNGTYPPSSNSQDGTGFSDDLYIALFYEGYDFAKQSASGNAPSTWTKVVGGVTIPKATKIYLPELDPTSSKQGWVDAVTGTGAEPPASTEIKDPWGTPYRYRSGKAASGTANSFSVNPDFDLWSSGKNARTNANLTHQDAKDDLRNF